MKDITLTNLNPKEWGETEMYLQMEIDKVQEFCRKRLLDPRIIKRALMEIEIDLDLSRDVLNGTEVIMDCFATDLPVNYYNQDAKSTQFRAECRDGFWVVTDVFRAHVCPERMRRVIYLSEDAQMELSKKHEWSTLE